MRWNVNEDVPPLAGKAGRVLCDGREVRHVFALDTDDGWVDAYCCDANGRPYIDPLDPSRAASERLFGVVRVEMADGTVIA